MPHPLRLPRVTRAASLAAFALAALALAAALPAHAGLGDMMNKAKKSLGASVTPKSSGTDGPPCKEPEFNTTVLELTEERVAKIAEALKLDAPADRQRVELQKQQETLRDQMSAINDKYSKEIDAARQKRDKVEDCWRDLLNDAEQKHQEEAQQKMMSDPAARQQMIDLAQQMAKAQQAGDTETMKKLEAKMKGMTGNTHADTVAAQQKCGAMPPLHPQQAKLEALEQQSAQLDEQMRDIDKKLKADHQRTSGLDEAQFAMARERIEMYLARLNSGSKPCGVTETEAKAIQAHRAELEAALKTS